MLIGHSTTPLLWAARVALRTHLDQASPCERYHSYYYYSTYSSSYSYSSSSYSSYFYPS